MKKTDFISIHTSGDQSFVFDTPSKPVVFLHNVSGTFNFDITSSGVDLKIFGLFIGKKTDTFSVHTIQRHIAPQSSSNLYIKGIFRDQSKFKYQGLIRIEKEGQKSHAYQKNQNLILSPSVFIDSRPYLEILANDVFCTHGSTTGKVDKEQLYYAQTRGFSHDAAQQLLVDGFIQDMADTIQKVYPSFQLNLNQ